MIIFKYRQFQKEIILQCVRWYLSYPLSSRNLEEIMKERGVSVDHSTVNRWVLEYAPQLEASSRKHRKRVGKSWRLDETYIRIKGKWKYLYRAVDKEGDTVDFLLTAKRDRKAAMRFLKKAIKLCGTPDKVNIDKSGANTAALKVYNEETGSNIEIRQSKYLNNVVEQDHRNIKRKTRSMLGFKSFYSAARTLAGIELVAMIKKGQISIGKLRLNHEIFYALAT